jgi:signal transduction histidine kinase
MTRLGDRSNGLRSRLHLPRGTVRLRLTLLYGGLLLLAGVALLAITYVLVRHSKESQLFIQQKNGGAVVVRVGGAPGTVTIGQVKGSSGSATLPPPGKPIGVRMPDQLRDLAVRQRTAQLHQLLVQSAIALGVMTVFAIWLGWLVAGRVLRPLQTMTATVRTMSAANLRERLAMTGPADELKDLGDTFDGLLDRLESSFEAQRQFVANASHELRTPLARQRTIGEVALRDPQPTIESLRSSQERMLAAGEQQEQLIDALLTLARGERSLDRREPVDLAAVAGEVLSARRPDAERRGLQVDASLGPATISGDANLVERLLANLVDNAVRHNSAGGRVEVVTGIREGRAVLFVANTGPVMARDEIEWVFEPFRRLGRDRTGHGEGFGLGLSIVQAIVTAHGATIAAQPRPGGGLEVEVAFPPAEQTGGSSPSP